MNIKILSDSTCDLPKELVEKYDIGILPLTVIKDEQEFYDAVTITPAEIFDHVAKGGSLCTTAARNIDGYAKEYARYADQYDGVICITIGSGFSSCFQNAALAAEDYPNVRTIDSMSLSTGQGMVVLKAAELAQTCADLDALKEEVDAFAKRVEISFVLDRLDYMVKGGRCSSATALGANLLHLRPCIEVKDGKMMVVKKYRGSYEKCLVNYIKDRLENRDDIDYQRLFITYTVVDDTCFHAAKDAISKYATFQESHEVVAGCTVSCHCGPGTLGIIFVRSK